ncbi:hypothetical protein BDAP_002745 [Binucleata daphniae]
MNTRRFPMITKTQYEIRQTKISSMLQKKQKIKLKYKNINYCKVINKLLNINRYKLVRKEVTPILEYRKYKKCEYHGFKQKSIHYDIFETKNTEKVYNLSGCILKINTYNLRNYAEEIFILKNYLKVQDFYEESGLIYVINDFYILSYKQIIKTNYKVQTVKTIKNELNIEYISEQYNKYIR